jgi:hypothetical protein
MSQLDKPQGQYPNLTFDFLGYRRPHMVTNSRKGSLFCSFTPAVSPSALKSMRSTIRDLNIAQRTQLTLDDIAEKLNPLLRGWIGYYGICSLEAGAHAPRRRGGIPRGPTGSRIVVDRRDIPHSTGASGLTCISQCTRPADLQWRTVPPRYLVVGLVWSLGSGLTADTAPGGREWAFARPHVSASSMGRLGRLGVALTT